MSRFVDGHHQDASDLLDVVHSDLGLDLGDRKSLGVRRRDLLFDAATGVVVVSEAESASPATLGWVLRERDEVRASSRTPQWEP
jgi:hypothetical protein